MISQILFTSLRAAEIKQNGFCRYIVTNKVTLCSASYSACVVYTKTIIHLSVGESGGYITNLLIILRMIAFRFVKVPLRISPKLCFNNLLRRMEIYILRNIPQ